MDRVYSSQPMGLKISALFKRRFIPTPPPPPGKKPVGPALYPGVVIQSNIDRCVAFLEQHKKIFDSAEKKYGVPPDILVSVLMVETKLGEFLGSSSPFWSLSCMASTTTPGHIQSYLDALPISLEHETWLEQTLRTRVDWAYKELLALISHARGSQANPLEIPGSVFGALGICQFMPSNIEKYAVDGDGDGRIDLFSVADATHSAANFLKRHGWKKGLSAVASIVVLKKYNNSQTYSNTIMALAQGVNKALKAKQKTAPAPVKPTPGKPAPVKPAPKAVPGAKALIDTQAGVI
jgi:membrane-bound lytic murein transglycosylase B